MNLLTALAALSLVALTSGDPTPTPRAPKRNPYLAETPYPIFHADSWASGAQNLRGPEPGDEFVVDFVRTEGASSWLLFGPRYDDGSRPIWGGTMNSVFKLTATKDDLVMADEVRLRGKSISDCFVLADGRYLTCDRARRRILVFADREASNSLSGIVQVAEFELPEETPGEFAHMNLTHDGWVVWATHEGYLGAAPLDFSRSVSYRPRLRPGEVLDHNSFPIDENGNIYIVTTARMLCLRFQDGEFSPRWDAPYDFNGTGRQTGRRLEKLRTITGQGRTGSGTTPTVLAAQGRPRMVAVVDGQSPNNMLLFWADDIPTDWEGLPGQDRRLAARVALPYSTPEGNGFTQENSPVGLGNELFTAQWNGFRPESDPVPGAQKLRWDPVGRRLTIDWTNPSVVMNGVPALSRRSGLVYSSGPNGGINKFIGLDWQTGKIALEVELPNSGATIDQGNQTILDDDRSAYFSGRDGVVRVRPVAAP